MSKYAPDRLYRNKVYMQEWLRLNLQFFDSITLREEIKMPMREFRCPTHGVFEGYVSLKITESRSCPKCGKKAELIEYSVPAKRNPDKGIQS